MDKLILSTKVNNCKKHGGFIHNTLGTFRTENFKWGGTFASRAVVIMDIVKSLD